MIELKEFLTNLLSGSSVAVKCPTTARIVRNGERSYEDRRDPRSKFSELRNGKNL